MIPAFATFYGPALLLALTGCALAFIVAPETGREIGKRCALSVLLFCLGATLGAPTGSGALIKAIFNAASFAVLVAAFVWLVHPGSAGRLLQLTGAIAVAIF